MSTSSLLAIAASASPSPGDSAITAAPVNVAIADTARVPLSVAIPDAAPYAIQLRISPAPIDPRSVPRLDIFDMYTLYCDVRLENGLMRHSLRLGFFKDPATAKVIARYLASYFEATQIVHLNTTEQTRSLRVKLAALKDIGDSGRHTVIELSEPEPAAPQTRRAPPRPLARPRAPDIDTRSLWSRLVQPR
jgi:hypothetical protein